jgi:hypothetical protein
LHLKNVNSPADVVITEPYKIVKKLTELRHYINKLNPSYITNKSIQYEE